MKMRTTNNLVDGKSRNPAVCARGLVSILNSNSPAPTIDKVFNKLVVTAFKYTPVVLEHHIPYKTLANGKL